MTLVTACLTFCAAAPNEITSFVALLLTITFNLVFLKNRLLTIVVGLPSILGFLSYSSFVPVALLVAPLFAVAFGAAVLLHAKKWWMILGWAIAGVGAVLLSMDISALFSVLLWAICSAVLALALEKGWRRTGAIATLSALLLVGLAVSTLLLLNTLSVTPNAETFTALIDQIREELATVFLQNAAMLDESVRILMTREYFDGMFDAVLVTLPATIVIAAMFFAFFAHLLTLHLCKLSGRLDTLSVPARIFLLTPATAIVYLLSLVLMIAVPLVADDALVLSVTAQNLTLILTPVLALVGWFGIYGFLTKTPGCLNVWVLLGLAMAVIYSQGIALYIVAILGVYLTFRANKRMDRIR